MTDRKPLFVPLATGPYRWFESGAKTVELRRIGGQWQPKHVPAGRLATLSRGYSTPDRMPATVGGHVVGNSILDVLQAVGWKSVIPTAAGPEEASTSPASCWATSRGRSSASNSLCPTR